MSRSERRGCPDGGLVAAFVDDELTAPERTRVQSHLLGCEPCRADVDGERRVSSMLAELSAPAPDAALLARLVAVQAQAPEPEPERSEPERWEGASTERSVRAPSDLATHARRRSRVNRLPAFTAAAASVAVFMVGGFAFLGASEQPPAPSRNVAVVPAVDRLTMEHAATTTQGGVGGPGFSAVPVSGPVVVSPAGAR